MSYERGYRNDVGDWEPNKLYEVMRTGHRAVQSAKDWGMRVGDWELLSLEERENLAEWEELLKEDVNNDSLV